MRKNSNIKHNCRCTWNYGNSSHNIYTLIAEAQNTPSSFPNFSTSNVDNLTDEKLEDAAWENFAIPYFMDGKLSHVVVPSRETDFFYGEKSLTLMPIEEFYEIYGTNATIHGLNFWMP
ncbi:MAG: hypothetical protein FWC33_03020 [Candidatus Bathyarchaeota archaeon]|nr:hypothetical protein [Candidatus Termiticorpusculum sp.]